MVRAAPAGVDADPADACLPQVGAALKRDQELLPGFGRTLTPARLAVPTGVEPIKNR
jgi:hypothetical protein